MASPSPLDSQSPTVREDSDVDPPAKRPTPSASKSEKIVPYKLKDSDKKMVYESGTVIYTEEFKRSVWDYLLEHSLAESELRYPEISHSVLYKWRRKAHEERGLEFPLRRSLASELKKEPAVIGTGNTVCQNKLPVIAASIQKERRSSEPPKVPKLKISLKLPAPKCESRDPKELEASNVRPKLITAICDNLSVEKKVKIVMYAIQNSTQKAANCFGITAADVHTFMSQNAIRHIALQRIRKRASMRSLSSVKNREEMAEIVEVARNSSVDQAARQFGVHTSLIIHWLRYGLPPPASVSAAEPTLTTGIGKFCEENVALMDHDSEDSKSTDFKLEVLDMARKQSLSRACKAHELPTQVVLSWMRQFFSEEEVRRVQSNDDELGGSVTSHARVATAPSEPSGPIPPEQLEQVISKRLQQSSPRIRVLDTGEMQLDKVVAVLKVALLEGSKAAASQFNIPRTTISTWLTRHNLEGLVSGSQNAQNATPSGLRCAADAGMHVSSTPTISPRNLRSSTVSESTSPGKPAATGQTTNSFLHPGAVLPHRISSPPSLSQTAVSSSQPVKSKLTLGDELEAMEDEPGLPASPSKPLSFPNVGSHSVRLSLDSNNNSLNGATGGSSGSRKLVRNGDLSAASGSAAIDYTICLDATQVAIAQELGITMTCWSRWLECRPHFLKLRQGKLSQIAGNSLLELLSFRLDAVSAAQNQGRLHAASTYRVTLSELHEWISRRGDYLRVLCGRDTIDCVAAQPKGSFVKNTEHATELNTQGAIKEAKSIAAQLGLDFALVNQFIQQLYDSYAVK